MQHVIVTGRVQGVGYRWFVRAAAIDAGVSGWVRNRRDGSVEAALRGTTDAVDAVIAAMRIGPAGSEVAQVRAIPAESETGAHGFEIVATL